MRGLPNSDRKPSLHTRSGDNKEETFKKSLELERHVSFNLEEQTVDSEHERPSRRKRAVRRFRLFGAFLFLGLLAIFHISRHHHRHQLSINNPSSQQSPNCHSASFTFNDPDQFTLKEVLDTHEIFLLDISGKITIASDLSDQKEKFKVDVSMTSHNIEIQESRIERTETSLEIHTPELANRSYWKRPRLVLDVTIHVARGSEVDLLQIYTRHLNVGIFSNLSLAVRDDTKISTVNGQIHCLQEAASWTSRNRYLSSTSGGIKGEYGLEDVLSVSTTSGGIRIRVIPKPASQSRPAPASFTASSSSGHIDATFDTLDAPERDYQVETRASAGGTSGRYIHGSRSSFTSNSGSVRVAVVPFGAPKMSELRSEHSSGGTEIRVESPLRGNTLGALRSSHRSVSGSLRLYYPSEWEGEFKGTSVSGHLSASGRGLEVEWGSTPGLKRVSGRKGEGGLARLEFDNVSGGTDLVVG